MNSKILSTAVIMASLTMINVASADHSSAEHFDYRSAVEDVYDVDYLKSVISFMTKSDSFKGMTIDWINAERDLITHIENSTSGAVFEGYGGVEAVPAYQKGDIIIVGTPASDDYLSASDDYAPASDDFALASDDYAPASIYTLASANYAPASEFQEESVAGGTGDNETFDYAQATYDAEGEELTPQVGTPGILAYKSATYDDEGTELTPQEGTAQVGIAATDAYIPASVHVPASANYAPASEFQEESVAGGTGDNETFDYVQATYDADGKELTQQKGTPEILAYKAATFDADGKELTPQEGTAQVGTAEILAYKAATFDAEGEELTPQEGTAQVGTAQVGTAQVGTAQVGTAQVGTAASGNSVVAEKDSIGKDHVDAKVPVIETIEDLKFGIKKYKERLSRLKVMAVGDNDELLEAKIKAVEDAIITLEAALKSAEGDGKDDFEAGAKITTLVTALEGYDSDELESKIKPDVGVVTSGAIAGLNAVNGSVVSHQSNLIANSGRYGLSGVSSGLNAGGEQNSNGAWLKVFGSTSDMGMRDDIAGYDADALGIVIGIDKVNDESMIGFAFSSTDIDVEGKSSNNSKTESNSYQGTLYGTILNDNHYINASLAYAHSTSDTSRTGIDGTVTGEFDTKIFSAEIGAGIPIKMDSNLVVTPEIKMSYSFVDIGDYTEEGVAALNINPEDMDLLNIKVGTTFSNKMGDLTTNLRLIADWDVTQEKATVNSSFASTGAALPVSYGPEPSALGGIVGVGIDYASSDGVYVLNLNYDAGIRPDFISHTGSAKVRMNF